jgi:hypothetical protein
MHGSVTWHWSGRPTAQALSQSLAQCLWAAAHRERSATSEFHQVAAPNRRRGDHEYSAASQSIRRFQCGAGSDGPGGVLGHPSQAVVGGRQDRLLSVPGRGLPVGCSGRDGELCRTLGGEEKSSNPSNFLDESNPLDYLLVYAYRRGTP